MGKERMYMGLLMKSANNPFVKQGTTLFKVPVTYDTKERDGILEAQVFHWLMLLSERTQDFQKAVTIIEPWLRQFCTIPGRKQWVERVANEAGNRCREVLHARMVEKPGVIRISLGSLFRGFLGLGG